MAIEEVVVDIGPGETRIALMDGPRLREVEVSREDLQSVAGNIYLGRVERTLPGIQAAFIDIGHERSGFLGLAEARPIGGASESAARERITDYVSEGAAVLVQALKDPFADKGAKLTTHITLPGRFVVFTPGQTEVKASRRIAGEAAARLSAVVAELAVEAEGFILRTAAAAASREDLGRDIAYLRGAWTAITGARAAARPPACLYRELDPVRRIMRDEAGPDLRRIVFNDPTALAAARQFCAELAPDLGERLAIHGGPEPLFDAFGIEEQIERALAPAVPLPSGGGLVVDEATALTVIDVNTGSHRESGGPEETALATNLEAAAEIARQLRLRNIGGLVVVDFVPMRRRQHGTEVLQALAAGVADDRSPTHVAGFTRMGLVEITRERRRPSLAELLLDACPACTGRARIKSPLTVALEVLRRALREAEAAPAAVLQATAAPPVIAALEGPARTARAEAERRLGRPLALVADPACAPDRFELAAAGKPGG